MSHWAKSPAARLREVQWKMKRGIRVLAPRRLIARSPITGKLVSSSQPDSPTVASPGADTEEATQSKFPVAVSPAATGHFPTT